MITAKTFKSIAAFLFLATFSSMALALEGAEAYQADRFKHAQEQGKMIVVDIYKDGCGTCLKQVPALEAAREMYPDAQFFRVDFASDDEAVKKFRAIKQSTIIVYRGTEERGRSMGETNKDKLLEMIASGV
ncbi:hypothetical protein MNBD_GAMMA18-1704 [hydrothermal vent metagenome]|uniref:Thioredoxin domain-containing protein n=1 Tax=hydrothermal vent metagenome TaxID=652676 RepID=A0A3B0ZGR8_9ZZZZ